MSASMEVIDLFGERQAAESVNLSTTPTEADILTVVENINDIIEGSKLTELSLIEDEEIVNGHLRRFGFTTAAGYTYAGLLGMPKKELSDMPFVSTSAWTTSDRGHNEHTGRVAVKEGHPFIFVSQEGGYRPEISNFPVPKRGLTLARSAAAVLSFASKVANENKYSIDAEKRILLGESRGGMVGMGVLALDQYFDQEIVYADLTAPCFPRGFERTDITKLARHIYSEPRSLIKMAGKFTLGKLLHYPSTLDLHPYSVAHQIAIGPALFSGEAGDMARLIDRDKIVHITCYNDDFASMPDEWRKIFANHPNVRVTNLEGSHLTLADPETMDYIHARRRAFRDLGGDDGRTVPGQLMFDRAHKLLPSST